MLQLRPSMSNVLGVLALLALVVPPAVMADGGASVRSQVIRASTAAVGGTVTKQELPGCSNPSEPFVGRSQGCSDSWGLGDWAISNGTVWSRGPRPRSGDTITFDSDVFDLTNSTALRGPRQTTSLDSINPETGSLSLLRKLPVMRSVAVDDGLWYLHSRRGPVLTADATYNSALASTSGVLGYGWSFPYSMSARVYRGTATITQENGSQVVFKLGTDHRFHAPPRVIASFVQNPGGSYTLTRGSSRSTCPSYLLQSCEAFTFSHGHLNSVKSPGPCKSTEVCGNGFINVAHDGAGRPISATDSSGNSLKFVYTNGHLTRVTGPGGVSEHFTYDSQGNLRSSTDPNGNTTRYDYDAAHRIRIVRDPFGQDTRYAYSSTGRVTGVTDALGNRRGFASNAVHHNTRITSPEGRSIVIAYQDSTVVSLRETGPGGGPTLAEWTFAYDPKTLALKKMVDPNLGVTTVSSDADGMPLTLTDALGKTTTFTYSDIGHRSSVTDPMGVRTKFTFDENGNMLTQSTPVTSKGVKQVQTYGWTYDDPAHPGDTTSSTDPLGNETDYTYDSRGAVASVTNPLGYTWTCSPSCLDRTGATITDPLGHTTSYTLDKNGNVLTTTDGTGATTINTYDADDELVSTTDPAGRKTTYTYDAVGNLTAVHRPDGTSSSATYGADGELLTTVDPAGGTRSFTYDGLGRVATADDQLGRTTSFAYDPVGNLTSTTDAMGVTCTSKYEGDRRLRSTHCDDGATPPVSYTYDADGRRTSMTDGTGTTTYEYDSLGRLIHVSSGSTANVVDVERIADIGNRITAIKYPNGHTVTMQYDANGQMACVTDWLGNSTQVQYNSVGKWKNIVLKRGFCGPELALRKTTTRAYDAADRIIHITVRDAAGNPDASFDYNRAADGRIQAVDSTGLNSNPQSYAYDANGRLGSENGHPVSFDSRDNVTGLPDGSTLSYNAADQLLSRLTGGVTTAYTVNDDGERTGATSAAQSLSYGWNGAGDLTSFTANGATTTYTLNGDGQRIMAQAPLGTHHTLVWDVPNGACDTAGKLKPGSNVGSGFAEGLSLVAARGIILARPGGAGRDGFRQDLLDCFDDPAGIPLLSDGTYSFIYGPDGLPIEQIDASDHALFLDEDAQGSVRLLSDGAGNVQGTASYDAFGNQTAQSGVSSPFGFDGMYRDAESGLYAMSCGVYDPATGQNLSESKNCTAGCLLNICGDGRRALWGLGGNLNLSRYTEWAAGPRHYDDLRCGDGIDESCSGNGDDLCVSSPYAFAGGDPVNARGCGFERPHAFRTAGERERRSGGF